MAAAVDSFEFLAREIIGVFTSIRDVLALVGVAFAAKRSLTFSGTAWQVIRVHGLARFFPERNLAKRYGPWAGRSSVTLTATIIKIILVRLVFVLLRYKYRAVQ